MPPALPPRANGAPEHTSDATVVGRWVRGSAYEVTSGAIDDFAAAVSAPLRADHAPPTFGVVPLFPLLAERALAPVHGAEVAMLHGEHVVSQRRPLRAGDVLHPRSAVTAIRPVRVGTAVQTRSTLTTEDGTTVSEHWSTTLLAAACPTAAGRFVNPEPRTPATAPDATRSRLVDGEAASRYAAASGDHNPIHLDAEAAREAGLEGIILHGLCTMAIAVDAVAADRRHQVTRAAIRFTAPVAPGSRLDVDVWHGDDVSRFVVRSGGRVVARAGLVEFSPATPT